MRRKPRINAPGTTLLWNWVPKIIALLEFYARLKLKKNQMSGRSSRCTDVGQYTSENSIFLLFKLMDNFEDSPDHNIIPILPTDGQDIKWADETSSASLNRSSRSLKSGN